MPHANGRIYIDTSTIPRIGINIQSDIATILGRNTGVIGQLCCDVDDNGDRVYAINKWAKYKPVANPIHDTTGQMENDTVNHIMKWKSSSNWWRATDGYCGFSIPSYASADALDGETDTWEYVPPTGDISIDPCRPLDFSLHINNAVAPFSLRLPDSVLVGNATMVQLVLTQNLADENLALTDIGDFADCYFGVAMFKDNNQPYFKTASHKLSVGDVDATKINIENIPFFRVAGTVRIYIFLGKTMVNNDNTRQYEHQVWFPNAEYGMAYREVRVQEQAQNVYLHGIGGFARQDMRVLGAATISISSGTFYATRSKVGQYDFSKIYTLASVVASAKLHSTGTVVDTQSLNINQSGPSLLEPGDPPGASYTFYCPMPVWSLPPVSDPDDYYEITITFNYS